MTPDNRSRIELIAAHYGRRVNARGVLAMPCVVHQGTNPKLELRPGDDDRIRATCYSQGCSYPETARVIEEQTGVRFNPSITGSTALPIVLRLRRGPERPAGPRGPPGAMMETDPDGSPLRPYTEAIAIGLGMEVSEGGDVQALITQLKSTAETAINAPTALEELDGETLAQYQREYLEHFPQPEDLPVDAATPAAWSSWLDAGECLDEALADSNRRLRDLYGTPAQWLWTTGSFLVAAIAIPGMPPWPLALHQVANHWKESSGWRVLHPLFPLMQETMMTPALPRRHITTVALPMRTIRDWLWPNGWHRGRDCPKLLEAFQTINQAWLPYEGMIDGCWQRRRWLQVTVVDIPATPDLDATVVLHIRVRPGDTGNGALIDRQQLRKYGAEVSAPLAGLPHCGLARDLQEPADTAHQARCGAGPRRCDHRPGRAPCDQGGRLETRWTHARAVWTGEVEENPAARRFGLLQVFTADDMVGFCFPGEVLSGAKLRKYRLRAVEHSELMHGDNAVVLEEDRTPDGDKGWRILRPAELRMPQAQPA